MATQKKFFKELHLGVVPIRHAQITVSAAEILLLFSTPKELVPAQGAGKYIEFVSAVAFLSHGGTSFTDGGNLVIQVATGDAALSGVVANSDLINAAADACVVIPSLATDVVLVANDAIELANATQVHAAGNGTLLIQVAYRVHDFS